MTAIPPVKSAANPYPAPPPPPPTPPPPPAEAPPPVPAAELMTELAVEIIEEKDAANISDVNTPELPPWPTYQGI